MVLFLGHTSFHLKHSTIRQKGKFWLVDKILTPFGLIWAFSFSANLWYCGVTKNDFRNDPSMYNEHSRKVSLLRMSSRIVFSSSRWFFSIKIGPRRPALLWHLNNWALSFKLSRLNLPVKGEGGKKDEKGCWTWHHAGNWRELSAQWLFAFFKVLSKFSFRVEIPLDWCFMVTAAGQWQWQWQWQRY